MVENKFVLCEVAKSLAWVAASLIKMAQPATVAASMVVDGALLWIALQPRLGARCWQQISMDLLA